MLLFLDSHDPGRSPERTTAPHLDAQGWPNLGMAYGAPVYGSINPLGKQLYGVEIGMKAILSLIGQPRVGQWGRGGPVSLDALRLRNAPAKDL